jgi:hypothetical protein
MVNFDIHIDQEMQRKIKVAKRKAKDIEEKFKK